MSLNRKWKIAHSVRRSGSILIIVLVTIMVLALSAYTFTTIMQTEEEATRLMTRRLQSKYLAESGIDYLRRFLSYDDETTMEKGGLWNNQEIDGLSQIPVAIAPNRPNIVGYFTVVAPSLDEEGNPEGYRFGLVDESSKLNPNVLPFLETEDTIGLARQFLMPLPDMTEEIADNILDFIDSDDVEREFGVESNYYSGQSPGYRAKNGPLDSLDELLLVRGVTPQLLYGADTNRNGIIDNHEATDSNFSALDSDMMLGWANYMTIYSKESNLNADGLPRINLNSPDLEQLYDDLRSVFDEEWSRFIINYRIYGPVSAPDDPEDISPDISLYELDFTAEPAETGRFSSVLDLVDAYTSANDLENLDPIIQSPIRSENMSFTVPILMQNCTTFEGPSIPGRINIMQAPRVVLMGIPGMTEELLEGIIQKREFELDDPEGADRGRKYETWLLTDPIDPLVGLATMKQLIPFICAGGDVYRAEIVGYFSDGVGTSRGEAVFDTTVPLPRLLHWKNKSHLQSGWSVEQLGIDLISIDN